MRMHFSPSGRNGQRERKQQPRFPRLQIVAGDEAAQAAVEGIAVVVLGEGDGLSVDGQLAVGEAVGVAADGAAEEGPAPEQLRQRAEEQQVRPEVAGGFDDGAPRRVVGARRRRARAGCRTTASTPAPR